MSWLRVTTLALTLHAPFVAGLAGDDSPTWLTAAWQVSATLVGLGVAVVVFLLQAASSQSLSSDNTYRSLLAYTGLIWPAAMALVFLVSVAAVERTATTSSPEPWAETWALIAFVVQILGFGIAFARTVQVVSPAGVRRVLEQSFRDGMRQAVRASLLRKAMAVRLHQHCVGRVSHGTFLTRGRPLGVSKRGVVYDVDLKLPESLAQRKLGERVTLTLDPGRDVGPDGTLAKLHGAGGRSLEYLIRRAVVIRDADHPASPVPVFEDVLDVARRALMARSPGNFKSALQLVVDCLADLPAAYARWGAQYTIDYVGEPFAEVTEDQIVRSLARFSEEVFRSENSEAVMLVAQVAAGLVDAGLRDDAALLVDQATSLWRRQLQTAHEVGDAVLERNLHEQIGRLGAQAVLVHQHRLEDPDGALESRLAAQSGLKQLFRHQIKVLKHYLDLGDEDQFTASWRHWTEWGQYWNPEKDVDDLALRVKFSTGADRRQAARALDAAFLDRGQEGDAAGALAANARTGNLGART